MSQDKNTEDKKRDVKIEDLAPKKDAKGGAARADSSAFNQNSALNQNSASSQSGAQSENRNLDQSNANLD